MTEAKSKAKIKEPELSSPKERNDDIVNVDADYTHGKEFKPVSEKVAEKVDQKVDQLTGSEQSNLSGLVEGPNWMRGQVLTPGPTPEQVKESRDRQEKIEDEYRAKAQLGE